MSDIANSSTPVQVEATRFRSSVSEALLQLIGGNINYLLGAVLPVGSIIHSMLTEAQMQDQVGTGWILADGGSAVGSDYALLTGNTTVPDLRGIFLRGKNNGRNAGATSSSEDDYGGNTAGNLALGTYEYSKLANHYHGLNYEDDDTNRPHRLENTAPGNTGTIQKDDGSEYELHRVNYTNDANPHSAWVTLNTYETSPRAVTVNIFIRIN